MPVGLKFDEPVLTIRCTLWRFWVGTDLQTAATMGGERYPESDRLMFAADGGGSNGSRVRLWKVELQKFADETRLAVCICHYPPGTSKWNKIEHRLFCQITQNWRGRPLTSRSVVELITATTTKKGLTVRCELDANTYTKSLKVSDTSKATRFIPSGITPANRVVVKAPS
jgi:Rhodopirellula transposase DDE domain